MDTHGSLLRELTVVGAAAVLVATLLGRRGFPTIAGLLLAGAAVGPHGLGLAASSHEIEVLAEIGVVFLLFSIGLEFSLERLKDVMRTGAVGGAVQVGGTAGLVTGGALAFGTPVGAAVVLGFVFALSSTAVVFRLLAERRELDAPHGRFIVGTLIFQDLCVVPMMLVIPALSPSGEGGPWAIGLALGRAAVVVALVLGVSRLLVPRLLAWVDAGASREVFLLAVLAICLGTAWLTSLVGLSLALGAFLGGIAVAGTEFGRRALGDVLPLRDAFVSLFFVSLGMLFDPAVIARRPVEVGAALFGLVVVKGLVASVAAQSMSFPARVAWLAGAGLAQFGEFGFVLGRVALEHGVASADQLDPVTAAGVISLVLTPLVVRFAPHVAAGERLLAPLERLMGVRSIDAADEKPGGLSDHVIVVGFGNTGRLTADALQSVEVPYVVIELNAAAVRRGRAEGLPVFYGDATSEEALHHAHVDKARALVIVINDPAAARRIVDAARRQNPALPILMRAHYLSEADTLLREGACEVVAEEIEGAVEMTARVLRALHVPRNRIDERVQVIRRSVQPSARSFRVPRTPLGRHADLADLKIESIVLTAGAPGTGRTIADLQLRSRTGATLVAIRRDGVLVENPDPFLPLAPGDVLYLVGTSEAAQRAMRMVLGRGSATVVEMRAVET